MALEESPELWNTGALPSTTALADVLQLVGETGWMSPPLRPVHATEQAVVGTARTVRLGRGRGGFGALRRLFTEDLRGRVIVVADADHATGAVWGEILTLAAQGGGASAVVVEGSVRDVGALPGIGLPVWSVATATAGPGWDIEVVEVGAPVMVGEVRVTDGDPVFLDKDGVVTLPRDIAGARVMAASAYERAEREVISALRRGTELPDAYARMTPVIERIRNDLTPGGG